MNITLAQVDGKHLKTAVLGRVAKCQINHFKASTEEVFLGRVKGIRQWPTSSPTI